jgi:hypothetical protein
VSETAAFRLAENIVAVLRELLAQAERGEIAAFACATIAVEGGADVHWAWEGKSADGFALQGAVSRLQYRLNGACDDDE